MVHYKCEITQIHNENVFWWRLYEPQIFYVYKLESVRRKPDGTVGDSVLLSACDEDG